ncbi:MAG: ImmA/IrrE family metallo-endopeptidase, partial [Spirochaetota bacterium]|nr:ImmA/IrrE family metallo-endopeptidase [Spirochaetota bacterium]
NLQAEDSGEKSTKTKAEIRKYMPVLEISKKGWFYSDNSALGYEKIYNKIWNTNSVDFSVYEKLEPSYCARQAKENEEYTRLYSLTWYQIARTFSKKINIPEYNRKKLETISKRLTEYTIQKNGVSDVIKDLNNSGVKFLVMSHLSKTYLDGACFFEGKNPVIVYTARYDRLDNFWFTLSHEIAHVLLHLSKDKKNYYLDNLESNNVSPLEKEADSKAEEILKVNDVIEYSKPFKNYFTDKNLRDISEKLRIEPSLILGILQYYKMIDYRKLSRYKKKVKVLFPAKVVMG